MERYDIAEGVFGTLLCRGFKSCDNFHSLTKEQLQKNNWVKCDGPILRFSVDGLLYLGEYKCFSKEFIIEKDGDFDPDTIGVINTFYPQKIANTIANKNWEIVKMEN